MQVKVYNKIKKKKKKQKQKNKTKCRDFLLELFLWGEEEEDNYCV